MEKERLTLNNIKTDLKVSLISSYKRLIVYILCCVISFGCVILTFKLENYFVVFIYKIFWIFAFVLIFALVVTEIIKTISLHKNMSIKKHIVKDKLIGMEIKAHRTRYSYYETYHLYFSGYGEYVIPDDNYKWSTYYNMSAKGLYRYSKCGEEFCLVLSKKHTGKILVAYNMKMFELENEGI